MDLCTLPTKKLLLSPMNIACVSMYFVYTHVYIVQGYGAASKAIAIMAM